MTTAPRSSILKTVKGGLSILDRQWEEQLTLVTGPVCRNEMLWQTGTLNR